MTRGMKIGIVVAIIVLLAGVGATVWVTSQSSTDVTNTANTNTTNTNTGSVTNTTTVNTNTGDDDQVTTDDTTVEVDDSAAVLRLARSVVSRYGSFSNQNNFENITSLEPFMTADFQSRSADYISKNQASEDPGNYYGISTEVISLELTDLGESTATVDVVTQRIEETADTDPNIFNQTAEVEFEKVEGYWKVENITWK